MSVQYGPRIVTDGLVLCLDASDPQSYPGSGLTWFDLSGQERHVTTNAVSSWVSDGKKSYWYFPDTNGQRISGGGGVGDFSAGVSLELWIRPEVAGNHRGLFEKVNNGAGANRLFLDNTNSEHMMIQPTAQPDGNWDSNNNFTIGEWAQGGLTYKDNGSNLGLMSWYYNGAFTDSDLDNEDYVWGSMPYTFRIGTLQTDVFKYKGRMAIIRQYNRALSEAEFLQNFNAMKNRFGLGL